MHCKEWLFLFSNRPQSYHRISLWAHGEKLYYVQWLIMARRLIPLRHAAHCCPGSLEENGKFTFVSAPLTWPPRLLRSPSPPAIVRDNAPEYGCLRMSHPPRALREADQFVCECVCVWEERWGHTHRHAIFLASTCCLWAVSDPFWVSAFTSATPTSLLNATFHPHWG